MRGVEVETVCFFADARNGYVDSDRLRNGGN